LTDFSLYECEFSKYNIYIQIIQYHTHSNTGIWNLSFVNTRRVSMIKKELYELNTINNMQ